MKTCKVDQLVCVRCGGKTSGEAVAPTFDDIMFDSCDKCCMNAYWYRDIDLKTREVHSIHFIGWNFYAKIKDIYFHIYWDFDNKVCFMNEKKVEIWLPYDISEETIKMYMTFQ